MHELVGFICYIIDHILDSVVILGRCLEVLHAILLGELPAILLRDLLRSISFDANENLWDIKSFVLVQLGDPFLGACSGRTVVKGDGHDDTVAFFVLGNQQIY